MSAAEPSTEGAIALIRVAAAPASLRSAWPAALHRVAGRTLLGWVAEAARAAGCERIVVAAAATTVGEHRGIFEEEVVSAGAEWIEAPEERETQRLAVSTLSGLDAPCLVLWADAPALEVSWLRRMIDRVRHEAEPLVSPGPGPTDSVTALPSSRLAELLAEDPPAAVEMVQEGTEERSALLRVTDRIELARVTRHLGRRLVGDLQRRGVTFVDPSRVVVEVGVEVAADVLVHPDVALLAGSSVEEGCELHQGAWLRASRLGRNVTVLPYSVLDGAQVSEGCSVGPFARLRPGTVLGKGARIGNFVEVKASRLGEGSKANHLAYIGDAEVGERVNIGAGAVTCNYDGAQKHRTEIGDDAFVGSDTMLVAPVRVGAGALTAAGSVIHRDVPDEALGVGRARQRNIEGWALAKGPRARKKELEKLSESAKPESAKPETEKQRSEKTESGDGA